MYFLLVFFIVYVLISINSKYIIRLIDKWLDKVREE
nr:MAG TPA: toxin [Caudoviricetes sp.]DAR87638.1 MAG TPA: toxin [Caudoviricetes sp.]DAS77873.1 MAG TPA: toxin [Caudoviricetes sp.]DAX47299.1 MAG TPA: toxin [Caudoviricetes sp.]